MRRALVFSLLLATSLPPVLGAQVAVRRPLMADSLRGTVIGRSALGDSIRITYTGAPTSRARIGVVVSFAPSANDRYGALIESVTPKGPADLAGIRANDIITRVNDIAIGDAALSGGTGGTSLVADRLVSAVSNLQPGKVATFEIRRGTGTLQVKVTPERDESVVATTIDARFPEEMGMSGPLRELLARGGWLGDSSRIGLRFFTDSSMRLAGPARTGIFAFDSAGGGGTMTIRRLMSAGDSVVRFDTTFTFGRGVTGRPLAGDAPLRGMIELRTMFDSTLRAAGIERPLMPALRKGEDARLTERGGATAGATRSAEPVAPRMTLRSSFDALSRLELIALNPELGSYFDIRDGVLVTSIAPAGVLTINGAVVPADQRAAIESGSSRRGAGAGVAGRTQPAADASPLNLKAGDVITAVDGRPVSTPEQLMRILRSYARNDDIKLSVFRQKKAISINTKMPS